MSERLARFLTMQEAADYLSNISAETLRRLGREGHLPVRRIGRKVPDSVTAKVSLRDQLNRTHRGKLIFYRPDEPPERPGG
jgi:excisionase family DNA binding protein